MAESNTRKVDIYEKFSTNKTNLEVDKTNTFAKNLNVLYLKMRNIPNNKNVIGSNFLSKIPKNNLKIQLLSSKFANKTKKVNESNNFKIEKTTKSDIETQGERETKSSMKEENSPNQKISQPNSIIFGNLFEQNRQNQDIHQLINFGDINSNQERAKFIGKKREEGNSKEIYLMNCFKQIELLYKNKNDEKYKIETESEGFFSKIHTIIENGKNICIIYTDKKITNIFLVKEKRLTNNEEEIQAILETLKKNIKM